MSSRSSLMLLSVNGTAQSYGVIRSSSASSSSAATTRQRRAQSVERLADVLACLVAAVGAEERAQQRGQHRLLLAAGVAQCFAQEVDAAALPGAAEQLRDRLLQTGVRVGDDQLHAAEAALDQAAQEAAPEGLRLGLADVERDHLAVAGVVHAIGEHQRLAHDAARVAHLLDLRVQPQVRIAALERAVAEGVDLLVETGADPRHLALRDPQPSDSTT